MLRPAHTDSGSSVDGEAENPHHTRVELSVEEATITKQETFLFNVFITSWGLNLARTSDVSTLQIHGTGYWGATCLQTNSRNRRTAFKVWVKIFLIYVISWQSYCWLKILKNIFSCQQLFSNEACEGLVRRVEHYSLLPIVMTSKHSMWWFVLWWWML